MKCFPFFHKKREMPKLFREGERDTGKPGPKYACTRCGKLWYDYIMHVGSPEGSLFRSLIPYWEGQSPPQGYDSWTQYRETVMKETEKMRYYYYANSIRQPNSWTSFDNPA